MKTLVSLMLGSNQPMFIAWGGERTLLYNDAYSEILANKHPHALGQPFLDVWHEIRADLVPIVEEAYAGRPVHMDDIKLVMERRGYREETHFAFSYTPTRAGDGTVAGLFCACVETTAMVLAQRRQAFLLALSDRLRDLAGDADAMMAATTKALARELGVPRVGYAEIDDQAEHAVLSHIWTDGTRLPNLTGRVERLEDYGSLAIAELLAGRVLRLDDIATDPRTAGSAAKAHAIVGARASLAAPIQRSGRTEAFMFAHDDAPRAWSEADARLLREAADRTWAAVEQAHAEAALRASEARWRHTFEQAPGFIAIVRGPEHAYEFVNAAYRRLFGGREFVGRTVREAFPDIAKQGIYELLDRVYGTGERFVAEQMALRVRPNPDGDEEELFLDFILEPMAGADGRVERIFIQGHDVTARKAAEERQALLAREVDHRAKNALAVVQAVVRLTRAEDIAGFVTVVEGRVAALARAHGLLAQNGWTGTDLRALVADELAPYLDSDTGRATLSGPTVTLGPDAVQPLAMMLHELATNAAKYGALFLPGGRVQVTWARTSEGGLRLAWHEAGGPAIAAAPERRGFGSQMLAAVAGQLGGSLEMDWHRSGLRCSVTIAPNHVAAGSIAQPVSRAGPNGMLGRLEGRRVLVAEDDALLALDVQQALEDLGCVVVGPARSLGEALRLAADEPDLDAAVLDVNLRGQEVWPAAEFLMSREVPCLFTTGYGQGVENRGAPVLDKPFQPAKLEMALRKLLG